MKKSKALPSLIPLILSCLALASCPGPIADEDLIYVKPASFWGGGDGSSPRNAISGLSNALWYARAGRTFVLLPGVYAAETAYMSDFDASDNPVTVVGAVKGEVILDGMGSSSSAISVLDAKGLVIKNLVIKGYGTSGLAVTGCEGVTIEGCAVSACGFSAQVQDLRYAGIDAAYSREVLIRENIVFGNGPLGAPAGNQELATGISAYALFDSAIRDNETRDNWGGGILVEDCEGMEVSGNSSSGHRATAALPDGTGDWFCGGIWADGCRDLLVSGNSLTDNRAGIYLSNLDVQPIEAWTIGDNVLSGNGSAFFINAFGAGLGAEVSLSGNQLSGNDRDEEVIDVVYWRKGPSTVTASLSLDGQALAVSPTGYFAEVAGTGFLLCRAYADAGEDWEYLDAILPFERDLSDALLITEGWYTFRLFRGGKLYLYCASNDPSVTARATADSSSLALDIGGIGLPLWGSSWMEFPSLEGDIDFSL